MLIKLGSATIGLQQSTDYNGTTEHRRRPRGPEAEDHRGQHHQSVLPNKKRSQHHVVRCFPALTTQR